MLKAATQPKVTLHEVNQLVGRVKVYAFERTPYRIGRARGDLDGDTASAAGQFRRHLAG